MSKKDSIPLSVYVHIPWCIHKCPYCDFNSHEFEGQDIKNNELIYTNALIKQLENSNFDSQRPIHSIFFGGGTPSLFSPSSFKKIIAKIKVMKENFDELKQLAQDAFEDGLLMEVSDKQLKKILHELVDDLHSPLKK